MVEALPAERGDCIFIRAALAKRGTFGDANPSSRGEFRILIDAGLGARSLPAIRHRLGELSRGVDGNRWIDLAVFTHLDADHIGNAANLLSDETLRLRFNDIWFNGHKQVAAAAAALDGSLKGQLEKSYPQADLLSHVIANQQLPLNRPFAGGPVVVPPGSRWLSVGDTQGGDDEDARPRITLLSPTASGLGQLLPGWDRHRRRFEEGRAELGTVELEKQTVYKSLKDIAPDIDALRSSPFVADSSIPNRSSIAFVLEHRGRQLVLLGDAQPEVYERAYLEWRDTDRPGSRPDVLKLSHHGSQRSTTSRTADFGATNYIISSDGQRFNHPDDVTLARLIADALPDSQPTFWFNYSTESSYRWARLAETDGRFRVQVPAADGQRGIGICLARLTGDNREDDQLA